MSDRVLVVTSPDDILLQGIRVAHVDLTNEQSSIVSNGLLQTQTDQTIINYVWKIGHPTDWLLDKLVKSDIIIFNANSSNELLVGWLAAQRNSHYFGILKDLYMVNDSAIYKSEDVSILLEKISKHYEQI